MTTKIGNTIGAYEAKTRLAELLEKVEAGEEVTITRHGAPVARLVPVKKKTTPQERAAAIARITELSKNVKLGGLKLKDFGKRGPKVSATFIADSSVALTWLFSDEATPATRALLARLKAETLVVPSLWFLEITNIVALSERKGRVTRAQSDSFLADLALLDLEVDADGVHQSLTVILPLCRQYKLTSYDATYLELALRRNLPLATLDSDLRKVAKSLGVALLGL